MHKKCGEREKKKVGWGVGVGGAQALRREAGDIIHKKMNARIFAFHHFPPSFLSLPSRVNKVVRNRRGRQ